MQKNMPGALMVNLPTCSDGCMHRSYFVYIVRCADHSFYVGITNNVESRLWQHNTGTDPGAYTFKRRPVVLVYSTCFWDVRQAIAWEKQIKRWSRKKKAALISGEYEKLSMHAVCKNDSKYLKLLAIRRTRYWIRHRLNVMVRQGSP